MSVISTLTDPAAKKSRPAGKATDPKDVDLVIRLRKWATSSDIQWLPQLDEKQRIELKIGTAKSCQLRIADGDRLVSGEHARLVFDRGWTIHDTKSKNGLWLDHQRSPWGVVRAGTEIGLGRKFVLIAESSRSIALRTFLSRILGRTSDCVKTVDLALRSILSASQQRSVLAVCSVSDPMAIAQSIHRVALGPERPFVRYDPRGKRHKDSASHPVDYANARQALAAAAGGTLSVWAGRLPRDYEEIWQTLSEPTATTRLVVCSNTPIDRKQFCTVPIVVPSLETRQNELGVIVEEYADDAKMEVRRLAERNSVDLLDDGDSVSPPEDREWIQQNESGSLSAIEVATLRCVALRMTANTNQAAKLLGIKRPSLDSWLENRNMPMQIRGKDS